MRSHVSKSFILVTAMTFTLSLAAEAQARGGGITGFQGAGAAVGGGPIGGNQRPSYSGRSVYDGNQDQSAAPTCEIRRDYYGRAVQVCD